jgi:hypothetical protein
VLTVERDEDENSRRDMQRKQRGIGEDVDIYHVLAEQRRRTCARGEEHEHEQHDIARQHCAGVSTPPRNSVRRRRTKKPGDAGERAGRTERIEARERRREEEEHAERKVQRAAGRERDPAASLSAPTSQVTRDTYAVLIASARARTAAAVDSAAAATAGWRDGTA